MYREAHVLIEDIHLARQLGEITELRERITDAELLVLYNLFLQRLPPTTGEELTDVVMSRYKKTSTLVPSNRLIDDGPTLLGDVVVVAPLLDRLMHHGHLLKFDGRRWRLKEAGDRVAKHARSA